MDWKPNEFKIGINMAGAVSAGAYTAGVLDFLMEALEEWQTRKDALRAYLANPAGPVPELVPLHDVTIEIFSGASAGGMCSAIASVMVQQPFTHIRTAQETGTNNTLYEAWVNRISIQELLKAQDVANGKPLVSLLDCTIIDDIAKSALTPSQPVAKAYISPRLTLILTLTNVRGTPYALFGDPDPIVEETTTYYGDKLQFETTRGTELPADRTAKPLPAGQPGTGAWPLLQDAAKATGAVPLALAPRVLTRHTSDYAIPPWTTACTVPAVPVPPAFPAPPPDAIETLNVDGGVTNNSPFQLAHDYLASQNPKSVNCHNPRPPDEANCAIVTVAPFPSIDKFNPLYDPAKESGLGRMLGTLVSVLLSQSRFLGESLDALMSKTGFSRFAIAPSDSDYKTLPALQCGTLGAFGGFFARGFRAHDFLLGRRNCQLFLKTHFILPTVNPVVGAGLQEAGSEAAAIIQTFSVKPARELEPLGYAWIPAIPCVGTTVAEAQPPARAQLRTTELDDIIGRIVARLKAIKDPLLTGAPSPLRKLAAIALAWPAVNFIKAGLRAKILAGLWPNAEGQLLKRTNDE